MNLNAFTARLSAFLKAFRYGDVLRPLRDWLFISIVGLLLLVGAVGWSYYLFTVSISGTDAKAAAQAKPVNTAPVDTVRTVFDARATERAHYQNDYHFVDPSR